LIRFPEGKLNVWEVNPLRLLKSHFAEATCVMLAHTLD